MFVAAAAAFVPPPLPARPPLPLPWAAAAAAGSQLTAGLVIDPAAWFEGVHPRGGRPPADQLIGYYAGCYARRLEGGQ